MRLGGNGVTPISSDEESSVAFVQPPTRPDNTQLALKRKIEDIDDPSGSPPEWYRKRRKSVEVVSDADERYETEMNSSAVEAQSLDAGKSQLNGVHRRDELANHHTTNYVSKSLGKDHVNEHGEQKAKGNKEKRLERQQKVVDSPTVAHAEIPQAMGLNRQKSRIANNS